MFLCWVSVGLIPWVVSALTVPPEFQEQRLTPRAPTCNTPSNRACWTSGFNINTDWETQTPVTGITRTYTLTLTEVDNWVGPDGRIKEKAMLINGQFPGPVITADWGDTVKITVINNLNWNGTSFHWHGIRQLNNAINDGASGVTECPIPPKGGQKTYTFLAQQYGTSWYHSHYSSQYANGVTGSIIINGPASLPYDIDLGAFPISDWYYGAADNLLAGVLDPTNPIIPGAPGAPPPSDNILFNGKNVNPGGPGGSYAKLVLTRGKRHRLRLINPSVDNTFTVSIVGHQMTVIANDFVPVNSFTTSSLYLSVGQRYDVTIDGSQPVGNYWINVTFSGTGVCGTSRNPFPAAILSYSGAPNSLPTNKGTPPPDSLCQDQTNFVPIVTRTVPRAGFSVTPSNSLPVTLNVDAGASRVFWRVNGSAIDVIWEKPLLQFVREGNTSWPSSENVIVVPPSSDWSFWMIQNVSPIPHPMHLHGHDFVILGRSPPLANPRAPGNGPRAFNPATDSGGLQFNNPIRRDATVLPAFGWLIVAFKNDNPGAWPFHCHIAWHASQGLSVQFLEKANQIPQVMDLNDLEPNCAKWRAYAPTNPFPKVDSGL